MTTENLGLILTPSEEWGTKKYRDFIEELAGSEDTSTLNVIFKNIGDLLKGLKNLETQLSTI